jgi:hypothetical protein
MRQLIEQYASHDDFFRELCKSIYPCTVHACPHNVNDLRILQEKPDPKSCAYSAIQIWRCSKCGGILRFRWDDVGSCEGDYSNNSVTISEDPRIRFDPRWNSDHIKKDLIIEEYIPKEVADIIYSAENLWKKKSQTPQE